jgi:hypothetical protein
MPVTLNTTGITFSDGTSQSSAGMVVDTNTVGNAQTYPVGQYLLCPRFNNTAARKANNAALLWGSIGDYTSTNFAILEMPTGVVGNINGTNPNSTFFRALTGTWRVKGFTDANAEVVALQTTNGSQQNFLLVSGTTLCQRTA